MVDEALRDEPKHAYKCKVLAGLREKWTLLRRGDLFHLEQNVSL